MRAFWQNYGLALILLTLGLPYVFLIPPFQSPDEPRHFLHAWMLSEGQLWPQKTTDMRVGAVLPAKLAQVFSQFDTLRHNPELKIGRIPLCVSDNPGAQENTRIFLDFANTALYAPVAYVPQAAGIACARSMKLSVLSSMYIARTFNLLCWIVLWAFAWKNLMRQFAGMVILALLPAGLVLAASCNADVLTNGFCILAFSMLTTPKSTLALPALALLLACIQKLVTLPFILLFWIKTRVSPWPALRWSALIVAATLTWAFWANDFFIPYDDYHPDYRDTQTLNEGVNPGKQIAWIGRHPVQFTWICIKSYAAGMPSITAHWIGKFGWEKNYLPFGWILILFCAVLYQMGAYSNPADKRERLLYLGAALGYIALFSVSNYALWHRVGAETLSNLQGRYFVPVLPLIWAGIGHDYLKTTPKIPFTYWLGCLVAANFAMYWAILNRYYLL